MLRTRGLCVALLLLSFSATLVAAPPAAPVDGQKKVVAAPEGKAKPTAQAKQPKNPKKAKKPGAAPFLRLLRDDKEQPMVMQTAIASYEGRRGDAAVTVDLVSVVHIGEKGYYQRLNREFEKYDVVLYELVAPKDTVIPKGGGEKRNHPVAMLQGAARDMLKLESQTAIIDYTKDNFVHADMTPKQLSKAMKKRGGKGVALKVVGEAIAQQGRMQQLIQRNPHLRRAAGNANPLSMMFRDDSHKQIKRLLAEQFAATGATGEELGATLNAVLVVDRNKVALKVLKKELAKGSTKVAIFYGAAHMPDFANRLKQDFGLKPGKVRWLNAWVLE